MSCIMPSRNRCDITTALTATSGEEERGSQIWSFIIINRQGASTKNSLILILMLALPAS